MATEEEKSDALVGSSSSSASTQRQRFYVELKPGETTIVSWRKLLREGSPIDQCPSTTVGTVMDSSMSGSGTHCSSAIETPKRALDDNSDVGEFSNSMVRSERLDLKSRSASSEYQQLRKRGVEMRKLEGEKNDDSLSIKHVRLEDMSARDSAQTTASLDKPLSHSSISPMVKDLHLYEKKSASFSSKSKCPSPVKAIRDVSMFPLKTKQSSLKKTEKFSSGRSRMKGGISGDPSDIMHQNSPGRCAPLQNDSRFRKFMGQKKIEVFSKNQHSEKSGGSTELLDVVSPSYDYSSQHSKSASIAINVTKHIKPFSPVLERAIRELEETVAEAKSFKVEASSAHTSWLTIERELPLQVKLKLGEVARIVRSSEEIMLEELVNCLVSIIGKLVHGKTLKRPLRKLVMLKLSARKEKAEKFKAIKNEILSMVSNEQIRAADFPEAKEEAILAETYELDTAMEDKLCDLYDLCVQGLSGDKGVEVQKLFIELGDLWPKGVMDHRKLRDAISRAKNRRRVLADKDKAQKAIKSDSLASPMAIDHNRTCTPVSCLKRKVTHSSDSRYLTSSPPSRAPAKTPYPLPKAGTQNFPTERRLKSSQKQQVPEEKHVEYDFSLKPQHGGGTHRYEEQAAADKSKFSRADPSLTGKQPGFRR